MKYINTIPLITAAFVFSTPLPKMNVLRKSPKKIDIKSAAATPFFFVKFPEY